MRKLRMFQHISLDGVIQQSVDENNFPYPNWGAPYRTPAGRELLTSMYGDKYDLLLGRRTYDAWSGFWPKAPSDPMADRLNAAKKFVATHRPETLAWGPFEAVGPDVVDAVRRIKSQDGPDLILCGSSTLTSQLLEHGLAEELVLLVNPVMIGTGKRLFADKTPARAFEFIDTHTSPTGILITRYKPAGPLKAA